ncbi:hypothetical protein BC827DRAFT_1266853 [Russula dissimulans]|nr:hypothetical protein BC827DRAFT_1266853 [Russula dissimulans]
MAQNDEDLWNLLIQEFQDAWQDGSIQEKAHTKLAKLAMEKDNDFTTYTAQFNNLIYELNWTRQTQGAVSAYCAGLKTWIIYAVIDRDNCPSEEDLQGWQVAAQKEVIRNLKKKQDGGKGGAHRTTRELRMLQYLAQKQGLEKQQEEEDPGYEMDVDEEHEYSAEESRLYGEPMEVDRSRIKRRRVRVEVPRKSRRTCRQNKLLVTIEGLDRMAQLEIVKKVVGSKLFSKYVGARDDSDSEDSASSAKEMASSADEETEDGEGSVNEKTEDGEDVEISRPLARLRIRAVCIEEQSEDASCDLQHLDGVCPDPHFDCSRRECHVDVKHPHFEPIECCPYYWAGTSSVEDEEQALTASEDHEAKNSLSAL